TAERFKWISAEHDVLRGPEKRRKYEQLRRYGAFAGAERSGAGRRPGSGGSGDFCGSAAFDLSDLSGFGGLGDLFSSIFGRRGRGDEMEETIETSVTIPFRVAALGGKVPVTLPMSAVCPTCDGKGAAPGATIST